MDQGLSRRFLTTEDFAWHEGTEDEPEGNELLPLFIDLLSSIVMPVFDEVYPELLNKVADLPNGIDVYEGDNNTILFPMILMSDRYLVDKYSESRVLSNLVAKFCAAKTRISQAVADSTINGYVKPDILAQQELSSDQFLVRIVDVDIQPDVIVSTSGRLPDKTPAMINFYITVTFHLQIEDISSLDPDGIDALRIRFNNLCADNGRYPENELRGWAVSLNVRGADRMEKRELCAAIRNHYNF